MPALFVLPESCESSDAIVIACWRRANAQTRAAIHAGRMGFPELARSHRRGRRVHPRHCLGPGRAPAPRPATPFMSCIEMLAHVMFVLSETPGTATALRRKEPLMSMSTAHYPTAPAGTPAPSTASIADPDHADHNTVAREVTFMWDDKKNPDSGRKLFVTVSFKPGRRYSAAAYPGTRRTSETTGAITDLIPMESDVLKFCHTHYTGSYSTRKLREAGQAALQEFPAQLDSPQLRGWLDEVGVTYTR